MPYDEVTLVTGYPAFRGRKMVDHLLKVRPRSLVYVVVHEKLGREAELHQAGLSHSERERLVVMEGDAAAMDLGLSGAEYRELGSRVNRIHHLAQVTYPGVSRSMAMEVNLGATREILELGRSCSALESIVIHSSASVAGDRSGVVYEHELNVGQSFRSPVEQTLARAERIARAKMAELPLCVVRPTHIVGDSRTGEVDRFDGPYMMMRVILSTPSEVPIPLPARGDTRLNLVPIDFVVAAAEHVSRLPAALGRTLHLADPHPLDVREVFELVAAAAGRKLAARFIPSPIAQAVLGAPGLSHISKSQRAMIHLLATRVRYDTSHADELLSGSVRCPPLTSYLERLVEFVRLRLESSRKGEPEWLSEDETSLGPT